MVTLINGNIMSYYTGLPFVIGNPEEGIANRVKINDLDQRVCNVLAFEKKSLTILNLSLNTMSTHL